MSEKEPYNTDTWEAAKDRIRAFLMDIGYGGPPKLTMQGSERYGYQFKIWPKDPFSTLNADGSFNWLGTQWRPQNPTALRDLLDECERGPSREGNNFEKVLLAWRVAGCPRQPPKEQT